MNRMTHVPTMLSASDKNEVRKVFVKNLADDVPDSFVESLLRVRFILLLGCLFELLLIIGVWICYFMEENKE